MHAFGPLNPWHVLIVMAAVLTIGPLIRPGR